jgi:hypothetical protein
MRVICW